MYFKFKHFSVGVAFVSAFISAFAAHANVEEELKQAILAAFQSDNPFVFEATVQAAIDKNPSLAESLHEYATMLTTPVAEETVVETVETQTAEQAGGNQATGVGTETEPSKLTVKPVEQVTKITNAVQTTVRSALKPPPLLAYTSGWQGSATAGIKLQSGNTEKEDVTLGLSLLHDATEWRTTIDVAAEYVTSNGRRTDETYTGTGRVDRKLNDTQFIYVEGDAERDLFSGYRYKFSEIFGYGHRLEPFSSAKLDLFFGVGGRHSETDTSPQKTSNEWVAKPALTFVWPLRDGLEFKQTAQSTMGQEFVATKAETSLKTRLMRNWFLKTSIKLENISKVPAGRKKTDTTTSVNLGYDF